MAIQTISNKSSKVAPNTKSDIARARTYLGNLLRRLRSVFIVDRKDPLFMDGSYF